MLSDNVLLLSLATWRTMVSCQDWLQKQKKKLSVLKRRPHHRMRRANQPHSPLWPEVECYIKDNTQQRECAKETYNRVDRKNLGYCCAMSEIQWSVARCTPDLEGAVTSKKDGGVFLRGHATQRSGSITQVKVKEAFDLKYSKGKELLL